MKDLISIIVPVYNIEPYLKRCVDSLTNQTYKNLEIILVDDGSPDNCPAMCDAFAEQDCRIKVIHKSNGGLSDARNAGLKIASGDYIAFVDSDDWVSLYIYEMLISVLKEQESDIVECGVLKTSEDMLNDSKLDDCEVCNYSTEEALKELILDRALHQTVWNKLYTRPVINDIVFEIGKTHEDEYWTYQVFARASQVSCIDLKLYYYYQRDDSIMGDAYSVKRLDALEAKKQRLLFFQEHYQELVPLAKHNLRYTCMYNYQKALRHLKGEEFRVAKNRVFNTIKLTGMNRGEVSRITLKQKTWYFLSRASLTFTCRLRNMLQIGE